MMAMSQQRMRGRQPLGAPLAASLGTFELGVHALRDLGMCATGEAACCSTAKEHLCGKMVLFCS